MYITTSVLLYIDGRDSFLSYFSKSVIRARDVGYLSFIKFNQLMRYIYQKICHSSNNMPSHHALNWGPTCDRPISSNRFRECFRRGRRSILNNFLISVAVKQGSSSYIALEKPLHTIDGFIRTYKYSVFTQVECIPVLQMCVFS